MKAEPNTMLKSLMKLRDSPVYVNAVQMRQNNTLRDDYYIFDQETYELRGEMTKKVYKLGDKVCVRVADADKMLKTVDFELVADIWNDEEEN